MFRATVLLCLIISVVIGAETKDDGAGDRIVNGATLMIKDLPCMVSLQRRGVHICGGFIFKENIVMTAAHCILSLKLEQATVRAGSTLWSSGGQVISVKKIIKHDKYDPVTKDYDIALLIMVKSFEFDVTVQSCEISTKFPGDGKTALIAGWGLKKEKAEMIPNMLQKGYVTTMSREKCSSPEFNYNNDIMDTMMCAHSPDGIDACQGDSGGPIAIGLKVYGLSSFGKGCGRKDSPGVYTLIGSVAKWIQRNTEPYIRV